MPPLYIFLANRKRLDQHTVHGEIHEWLRKQGGCSEVRFVPGSIRRHEVTAIIDPIIFLEDAHPAETVELRVAFNYPQEPEYEYYVIECSIPKQEYSFGWHQDEMHPDLGECHFQLNYRDKTIDRKPAVFHDAHPLNVLEQRISQIPLILEIVAWHDGKPTLSQWPPHSV